jgi:hypothetical protein
MRTKSSMLAGSALRALRYRIGAAGLRSLRALVVTPTPTRGLAGEPTHADQENAEDGDKGKESAERLGRWKEV